MSENRKRNETLTIRITKTEKAAIAAKAKKAELSLTDYLVTLSQKVVINPPPDLSPMLTQLKRIGNNLNQIAAKVNSGVTYVPGLEKVMELQRDVYDQLLKMTESILWQR